MSSRIDFSISRARAWSFAVINYTNFPKVSLREIRAENFWRIQEVKGVARGRGGGGRGGGCSANPRLTRGSTSGVHLNPGVGAAAREFLRRKESPPLRTTRKFPTECPASSRKSRSSYLTSLPFFFFLPRTIKRIFYTRPFTVHERSENGTVLSRIGCTLFSIRISKPEKDHTIVFRHDKNLLQTMYFRFFGRFFGSPGKTGSY